MTRARPRLRRGASRAAGPGRGAGERAAGALLHVPHRRPGHGLLPVQCRRRRRRRSASPRRSGRALVRGRTRFQPPLSRCGPRRAGDPRSARASTGSRSSGDQLAARGGLAGAARGPADRGGGLGRAAQVRRCSRQRGRRRLHERRLPRRRVGRGRDGGYWSWTPRARNGGSAGRRCRSPTAAADSTDRRARGRGRASRRSERSELAEGGGRALPLAAGGDPVQPAVLRQRLQESRVARAGSTARARAPRDS